MDEKLINHQHKLDKIYRGIFTAFIVTLIIGIIGLFFQVYSLSSQINMQVESILENQVKNRSITDAQNSLVLGYLICIGKIQPSERTDSVIKSCVDKARTTDITDL